MLTIATLPITLLITYLLHSVQSVPIDPSNNEVPSNNEIAKKNESYDSSQFDEIYDQRQNGSENYRVNFDKIVLVWAPPGSLLTAAMLLDPSLWESDDSDLDDFLKPETPKPPQSQPPEEVPVIKPETTKAPDVSTEATLGTLKSQATDSKRKFKIPGFIRPFVRRVPQL